MSDEEKKQCEDAYAAKIKKAFGSVPTPHNCFWQVANKALFVHTSELLFLYVSLCNARFICLIIYL
jgi:hypothetical protein